MRTNFAGNKFYFALFLRNNHFPRGNVLFDSKNSGATAVYRRNPNQRNNNNSVNYYIANNNVVYIEIIYCEQF